jgi:crotonobetaine/carnitine-CoA ligase
LAVERPDFSFRELPRTLHALLDVRAQEAPNQIFALIEGVGVTYGAIAASSSIVAKELVASGVKPGDRVMVLMPSSELYLGLWFGLSRASAIEVPVNPAYKGILLRQLVETAVPALCIVDEGFLDEFISASADLIGRDRIVSPQSIGTKRSNSGLEVAQPSPRDTSCIIFTSGTTGRSKGVMMSHRHQLSFAAAFSEIVELSDHDITYNFLPFFHIAAKFVALGTMLAGGKMVLKASGFSVSSFWPDVRKYGVTVCAAVGGLCHMLNSLPKRSDDAQNTLRVIYAVPVPWEFKSDFEDRFAVRFIEGYGGTESNLVAYSRLSEETPPNSLGRASAHFEMQIQDEHGVALSAGQAGEICIRPRYPATMMTGYFGMPEKSVEATVDLWFHTGDRGYFNEEGYLFFLDRLKDAIRRRGENISTFEVERIINTLSEVAESAVVPVPSELGEDEVKAFIVLKEQGTLDEEAIFRYAMSNMPYFMVPRFIEFRNELPRTPTMKVKKMDLRAEGNTTSTWDCEKVGLKISRHRLPSRKELSNS